MIDLTTALARFDIEMELAVQDSEKVLRDHGATDEEVRQWRKEFLPGWKDVMKRHRQELIRRYSAGPEATSIH